MGDNVCSLRIFAKIDDVMVPLMKELGLEIPEWKLQRFMKVKVDPIEDEEDQKLITISAVDVDGIDAMVFDEVQLRHNGEPLKNPKTKIRGDTRKSKLNALVSRNKFKFKVSNDMVISVDDQKENGSKNENESESGLVAELSFMGNYTEPNLCIPLCPLLQNLKLSESNGNDQENEEEKKEENQHGDNEFVCRLLMDIKDKKWTVEPYSVQPYSVKEIQDLAKGQEHQQKIDEFVKVTGLDNQSIAALFLKNSSWNLQIALSAFYEYAADPTVIPSMSRGDINPVVEQETLTSIMERRSEQLRRSQDDVTNAETQTNADSVDTQ